MHGTIIKNRSDGISHNMLTCPSHPMCGSPLGRQMKDTPRNNRYNFEMSRVNLQIILCKNGLTDLYQIGEQVKYVPGNNWHHFEKSKVIATYCALQENGLTDLYQTL